MANTLAYYRRKMDCGRKLFLDEDEEYFDGRSEKCDMIQKWSKTERNEVTG
jgi:hypothetical protein